MGSAEFGTMPYSEADDTNVLNVGLTLEDEFVLTRVKNKAKKLKGEARDQFLYSLVFKMVCRERAYRSVMTEVGLNIDTNVKIFEDDGPAES